MKKVAVILFLIGFLIEPVFAKQKVDIELYELMYKSFIYTNDLKHAYMVTKKVLKVMPFNLKWRKRVAQLALWLGKGDEAYKNFIYLYRRIKDPAIEKILFTLPYPEIIQLKIKKYEKQIKKGNYKNIVELAKLYEYEGYPEKSFNLLKIAYEKTKNKKYLYWYLKYAVKLSEGQILGKYTDEIKKFPLKEKYYMVYPLISKGDYQKALEILRYVDKMPKDQNYYNLLLFLLLKNGKRDEFIKIVKYLLKEDKSFLEKKENLSHIYFLFSYYYRKKDFDLLEYFYSTVYEIKRTKNIVRGYIDILLQNKNFKKALNIIQENRDLLEKKDYLFLISKVYNGLNEKEKALKIYSTLLKNYKQDLTLNEKKEILWFLIDNADNYFKILKIYLPYFEKEKELYLEVITAYLKIQEIDKAHYLAKSYIQKEKNNLSFLVLYADILNIKSIFDESYYYYHKAWVLANKRLKKDSKLLENKEFLRNYIRLSYIFSTPKKIETLFKIVKKNFNKSDYFNLKLDYHLYKMDYDAAFYMYNYKKVFR